MTGEEHYAEAERLIEMARDTVTDREFGTTGSGRRDVLYHIMRPSQHLQDRATLILADAQVHATLALAPSTATAATTGAGSGAPTEYPFGTDVIFRPANPT